MRKIEGDRMKKTGMVFLTSLFAVGTLFTTGCKKAPTADQAASLEETRLEAQTNEDLLAEKKKERLRLEEQLPKEESK